MERVADYMMGRLVEAGIRHVFLVTGRGILFLTDALARETRLTPISTYHEQGASYAAMAYAQAKGGLAACLVSTGCAATNAITAALCAWQDNVPVIFISGQHMLQETTAYTKLPIRTYGSQEADIVRMVKPITKYAVMLDDPNDIGVVMDQAIHTALTGRKGPVWVDIPLDLQNARIDAAFLPHRPFDDACPPILSEKLTEIACGMNRAERPVLLLGGGVRSAGAQEPAAAFAEKLHIPVVFTPAAADVYGSAYALSIGAVGSIGGSRAGNFAIQHADYILAVGTKLCSQVTGAKQPAFAPHARIDVVDIDAVEHSKDEVVHEVFLHADAREFFHAVQERELSPVPEAWREQCIHWKRVFAVRNEEFVQEYAARNEMDLYGFTDMLGEHLAEDATVITDAGLEELIVPAAIPYRKGQRCLFPAAQGAMGYAISAILGAHYAGKKNITAIVGDGSIMMNMQELYIIAAHRIPVKIFVINNDMYAVIRKRQRDLFRRRTIGNDPSDGVPAPDFTRMAQSIGVGYVKIAGVKDLSVRIDTVLRMEGCVLCEVMCTPDQKYLHQSYALNEKRRLEQRPLEDLSPFMEREKLVRERLDLSGRRDVRE